MKVTHVCVSTQGRSKLKIPAAGKIVPPPSRCHGSTSLLQYCLPNAETVEVKFTFFFTQICGCFELLSTHRAILTLHIIWKVCVNQRAIMIWALVALLAITSFLQFPGQFLKYFPCVFVALSVF